MRFWEYTQMYSDENVITLNGFYLKKKQNQTAASSILYARARSLILCVPIFQFNEKWINDFH